MRDIPILLLLSLVFFTGTAQDGFINTANDKTLESIDLVGIWSYRVAGVYNGYSRGLLIIDKTEGKHDLLFKLPNGESLIAHDLLVAGDKLQFHVKPDRV